MCIGRFVLVRQIMCNLIKRTVLCGFDELRGHIVVENVAHGFGEAKEDASASIGKGFIRVLRVGGESIDMTAEDTKEAEVGLETSHLLIG